MHLTGEATEKMAGTVSTKVLSKSWAHLFAFSKGEKKNYIFYSKSCLVVESKNWSQIYKYTKRNKRLNKTNTKAIGTA